MMAILDCLESESNRDKTGLEWGKANKYVYEYRFRELEWMITQQQQQNLVRRRRF